MESDASGITVTTATQSVDDIRARHGEPAPIVADPPPAAAAVVDAPVDAALEQEVASPKPDADVSAAARTLRASRSQTRIAKIQADIDAGTKEKAAIRAEIEQLRRDKAALTAPPPAGAPKADVAPPADPSAPPPFEFLTWEAYQVAHPDEDFAQYTDARTDARYAYNDRLKADRLELADARAAVARDIAAAQTATEAFIAAHPDYDEVLGRVSTDGVDPRVKALVRERLVRAGALAPSLLYHLGTHPAEAAALFASTSRDEVLVRFGAVTAAVQSPSPAPVASAPPPARPATAAPTPLTPVAGGATHTRTLAALAEDSDDADAYIARRQQEERAG